MKLTKLSLFACTLLALAAGAAARADVKCAPTFGDHMVLQRDMKVPVWGTADAGEKITVQINGQKQETTAAADGKWSVKLDELKAGGPFELTVTGKNTQKFTDVLVGEVWVCSGQSNMEFNTSRSDKGPEEVAAANYPQVRLFHVPRTALPTPATTCDAQWVACSPSTVGSFTAVGYFFGRHLHKQLNVPVGLIESSWGGTPAESWTPLEVLRADKDLKVTGAEAKKYEQDYPKALANYETALAKWKEAAAKAKAEGQPAPKAPAKPALPGKSPNVPASLYNGMIHPLVPYGIRGAIWYQGEANTNRAWHYQDLLTSMITSWRNVWGQGDFPFLIVQLANFDVEPRKQPGYTWAELREAQLRTAQKCPNTGLAVTIDIGNPADIHPTNKQEVGRRLGLAAEKIAYGRDVVYSGPIYESMAVEGNKIRVKFQHASAGLVAKGDKLTGFAIAGDDHKFVPAEAAIDGSTLLVSSPEVAKPVAVRYGWTCSPTCNLYNKENLPASPFRTDDLPYQTRSAK